MRDLRPTYRPGKHRPRLLQRDLPVRRRRRSATKRGPRGHTIAGIPILSGSVIVLDTECDGLKTHHGARPFCIAYHTDEDETGYLEMDQNTIQWLNRIFSDPTKTVVFHNAKFDIRMLDAVGVKVHEALCEIDCTLILSKIWNPQLYSHKLADLGEKLLRRKTEDKFDISEWLGERNTKAKIKKRGYKLGFKDAPEELVKRRAMWDVETTLLLWYFVKDEVIERSETLYRMEQRLMWCCLDMEDHGVLIDITHARHLQEEAEKNLQDVMERVEDLVLPITIQRKKKEVFVDEVIEEDFKPGSKLHMPAAFEKLGIELKYKTKPKKNKKKGGKTGGGGWSFDEYSMIRYSPDVLAPIIRDSGQEGWSYDQFIEAIDEAAEQHDLEAKDIFPALILKAREIAKMSSTYYQALIDDPVDRFFSKHLDGTRREFGVLHARFKQTGAETGRFSSSDPNLQNMPRKLGPRECFVPRPGCVNIHLDYSQVEMRFFVHFSEDEVMAEAIDNDIHMAVACRIYGLDEEEVSSEQRKKAKGVNFGIIYGSGAATQAETLTKNGIPTSVPEAKKLVRNYHREFPSVRRLMNELEVELISKGYLENPFGRRYYVPRKYSYRGLNYMCQGTSADLLKFAMVEIWEFLAKEYPDCRIIMQVHDELVIECPTEQAAEVSQKVAEIMNSDEFFVPIVTDCEIAEFRWSHKKDFQIEDYLSDGKAAA